MCPSKKLDHCFLGPFLIMEKVSSHVFQLGLSLALSHIHPVFHISHLQPNVVFQVIPYLARFPECMPVTSLMDEAKLEDVQICSESFPLADEPSKDMAFNE